MRIFLILLIVLSPTPLLALELTGIAEFEHRLTMNSSISARVEQIHVNVGESVVAGDLLLSLVSTGLQSRVNAARAQVEWTATEVEKMKIELDKARELYERDAIARVLLLKAEQDHSIASARLHEAGAKLRLAQFNLSQARIRSPIDGIVLDISTFPGQYINTRVSDQTLLTLTDNTAMSVQALLPVERYSKSLLNRPAVVTYLKKNFAGKVVAIDRQISRGANNHPALIVQVLFRTDGTLPSGLPVRIRIETE